MPPATTDERGPRRFHRKSRTGCLECRNRRVKCDEVHPVCRKCAIGNRRCVYVSDARWREDTACTTSNGNTVNAASRITERAAGPRERTTGCPHRSPLLVATQPSFRTLHMQLLYHAFSEVGAFTALDRDVDSISTYALDHASTAPYILDQLLALSASHCSTTKRDPQGLISREATELQTRALCFFNQADVSHVAVSGLSSLVYISLLGIQLLHDTLTRSQQPIGGFVADFVSYMRIFRGVRKAVDSHWSEHFSLSGLNPLLDIVQWMQSSDCSSEGSQTAPLATHFQALPEALTPSVQACLEALQKIQWVLNMKGTVPEDSNLRVHATISWSVMVCEEYVESLHQRRPEALAVLAFFAAMTHQRPAFWGFQAAGPLLVRSIVEHIGPFWADSLIWPQSVISSDRSM
jgi:hypothetical protein